MRIRHLVRAIGALLAVPAALAAQGKVMLVAGVADNATGAPLDHAEVLIPELGRVSYTDWMGETRIPGVPAGTYRIRVRHIGFAAADIQLRFQGDSIGAVFMLTAVPRSLDTVRVVASPLAVKHREFEWRRRMGVGHFVSEAELDREGTRDFAVVMASRFPGLMLVAGRGGQLQLASRRSSCGTDTTREILNRAPDRRNFPMNPGSSRSINAGTGSKTIDASESATSPSSCFSDHPCHVKLFLDDVPVAETDINIVKTWDLYGVEYYPIGEAPPQYRTSGAACGIMLLWSR